MAPSTPSTPRSLSSHRDTGCKCVQARPRAGSQSPSPSPSQSQSQGEARSQRKPPRAAGAHLGWPIYRVFTRLAGRQAQKVGLGGVLGPFSGSSCRLKLQHHEHQQRVR